MQGHLYWNCNKSVNAVVRMVIFTLLILSPLTQEIYPSSTAFTCIFLVKHSCSHEAISQGLFFLYVCMLGTCSYVCTCMGIYMDTSKRN